MNYSWLLIQAWPILALMPTLNHSIPSNTPCPVSLSFALGMQLCHSLDICSGSSLPSGTPNIPLGPFRTSGKISTSVHASSLGFLTIPLRVFEQEWLPSSANLPRQFSLAM